VAILPALPFCCHTGAWELSWHPAHLAREGPPLTPACMRLWLGSACSLHAGQGSEPKGISLCFLPTHFIPSSLQPSVPAACPPSPGGCSPGAHKAWHPASDPFLAFPPRVPGGQRDYEPHPELAITHAPSWGFGMSELEGLWECHQPSPPCTDRR
jgi:hypothetical protein